MKIKHKGPRQPKIKDTSKSVRKVDLQDLAERLGADVVIEAPDFGGGPMGIAAKACWFSKRQAMLRMIAEQAGFKPGEHVRIWTKDAEMSVAGRVRRFQLEPIESVVLDCVDGQIRTFVLGHIDRVMNFGSIVELPQVGRYKGYAWWKEKKDEC